MAHRRRRKRPSRAPLVLLILILLAVLLGLTAWAMLRETPCSGGVCPEVPTTEDTEPTTTEPPTTTQPPTTEPPTEPEPVAMRVVTPIQVLDAPREDGAPVQELAIGQQVEVLPAQEGWYALEQGYVPSYALREPETFLIVIDPGHQGKGNNEKEPVGPGATEKKPKVASGTQGVSTGIPEYKLTLQVSLKLRDLLEAKGYQVMMIRTDHDVNISNAERAQMANAQYADLFIRIHANGASDRSTNGVMTLCQTVDNPYNGDLFPYSKELSQLVLEETVAATGANRQFVWETDTMSGINWCRVPVTIVEMGYMSNPEEDQRMATDSYQDLLAQGMAAGIDRYCAALPSLCAPNPEHEPQ